MFWLFLLLSVFLIPVLLLAVPIEIEFSYDNSRQITSKIRIVWLFGLVCFQPTSLGSRSAEKDNETKDLDKKDLRHKKKKYARAGTKKNKSRVVIAIIKSKGFVRRVFQLIVDIITVAEIRQLRARIFVGLEDPADTGLFFGLLAPSFSILYAIPRVDFIAVPVFDREVIEANIKTNLRIVPINYITAVLSFLFSKECFRALRVAHRAYRI